MTIKPLLQLSPSRRRAIETQINRGFSESEARKLVSLPASVRNKIKSPTRLDKQSKAEISRAFRGLPVKERKTLDQVIEEAKEKERKNKKERKKEDHPILTFPWVLQGEKTFVGNGVKVDYKTFRMMSGLESATEWIENVKMLLNSGKLLFIFRIMGAGKSLTDLNTEIVTEIGTGFEENKPTARHNINDMLNKFSHMTLSVKKFLGWEYFIVETKSRAIQT